MKTTNKKTNNRKKILPAAGMLAVSAAMLGTATFAWFTMSREVEVKNIKMTATVPEDLQISLGTLGTYTAGNGGAAGTYTTETSETGVSLVASTGVLMKTANASNADDGNVLAPTNTWDWSNSADISAYYQFGRLMPASSTTGENVFYTPDADGVGKTVKANANYYQASKGLTALKTADVADTAASSTATSCKTTLHAITADDDKWSTAENEGNDAKNYSQATNWKTTNDDGYYVDIPVWIRTSSNEAVDITVDGYIVPDGKGIDSESGTPQTDLELYRAVRVAILDGETVAADAGTGAVAATAGAPAAGLKTDNTANVANILPLKDAWVVNATDTESTVAATAYDTKYKSIITANMPYSSTLSSILDSINYKRATVGNEAMNNTDLYGVQSSGKTTTSFATGEDYYAATYAKYTAYDATNDTDNANEIATIAGSTTANQYGAAKKLIIRVWLDGEDQECWNDNAGQDWNISLKFSKIEAPAQQGGGN